MNRVMWGAPVGVAAPPSAGASPSAAARGVVGGSTPSPPTAEPSGSVVVGSAGIDAEVCAQTGHVE